MSDTTSAMAESATAFGLKASAGGGTTGAVAFHLGANEIGWISLGIAFVGLLIQIYFGWQRNKREKEIYALKKKKLTGECDANKN